MHVHTSPGRWRAMTAVLLLLPGTPALFQGQEYCAPQPFLYFNDVDPKLAEQIANGRKDFLRQFPSLALPEIQQGIAEPSDPQTFARCKLDPADRRQHAAALDLHRDLLRLRREDAVFAAQDSQRIHGHVLSPDAFALRYFGEEGDDRLLIVNFGARLHLTVAPFPLLAPPWEAQWSLLWSSEEPHYGGTGTPAVYSDDNWHIPAEAALVMGSGSGEWLVAGGE
jgi:maltooligosyltrehalose trehalohydrolase